MRRAWHWLTTEVFDPRKRWPFGAAIITVGVWSFVLSHGGPDSIIEYAALALSLLLIPMDWRAVRRFLASERGEPSDPHPVDDSPPVAEPPSHVRRMAEGGE